MNKQILLGTLFSFAAINTPLHAEPLNVMAYNIMQLSVQDWDQANRAQRLPAAITSLPTTPDVLLISEAFNGEAEQALAALATSYPYQTPNVGQDCSGKGWDSFAGPCSNSPFVIRGGVVIVSKYPIVRQEAQVFSHSLKGSWDYYANKGFAYVEIVKNGEPFHLIATHLQATHDDDTQAEHQVRLGQLGEIKQFIDAKQIPSSEAVIVGGDMNVEWSKPTEVSDMLTMLDARCSTSLCPRRPWYLFSETQLVH